MSQIAGSGGQPQKPPKYAPIYVGRIFNGLNTNRSPLRAASASHLAEKYYSDNSTDALIAGVNVEISNRLTLIRRPGNPLYDQHTYDDMGAFGDFRGNKSQSDVIGTTLESIFTTIDEANDGFFYSLSEALQRGGDTGYNYGLAFQKSTSAGQTYSQAVGNSLYFANGVDNKKWLSSLFVRTNAGNNTFLQGTDGLSGTYPFGTYLVDPATGNLQQFIGISTGSVTHVTLSDNILTLAVDLTDDTRDYPIGTAFELIGMDDNPWLNGATIILTQKYDHTVMGRHFIAAFNHEDVDNAESGDAFVIQAGTRGDGTTPYIAETGSSVPTYGTDVPQASNNFFGSLTLDGNTVWINRGTSVENWGINPPTAAPEFTAAGSAVSYQKNTYYSPASVFVDPDFGNLWQITTSGTSGSVIPTWPSSVVPQQKVVISSVYSDGTNIYFVTDTQSPALVAGDTVRLQNMCTFASGQGSFPNLNGLSLTVSATGLTTTAFQAPYTATVIGSITNRV